MTSTHSKVHVSNPNAALQQPSFHHFIVVFRNGTCVYFPYSDEPFDFIRNNSKQIAVVHRFPDYTTYKQYKKKCRAPQSSLKLSPPPFVIQETTNSVAKPHPSSFIKPAIISPNMKIDTSLVTPPQQNNLNIETITPQKHAKTSSHMSHTKNRSSDLSCDNSLESSTGNTSKHSGKCGRSKSGKCGRSKSDDESYHPSESSCEATDSSVSFLPSECAGKHEELWDSEYEDESFQTK